MPQEQESPDSTQPACGLRTPLGAGYKALDSSPKKAKNQDHKPATARASVLGVLSLMIATTTLLLVVARCRWRWPLWCWPLVLAVGLPMLLMDGAFVSANLLKIRNGGWFPLALGLLIFSAMTTWRRDRRLVRLQMQRDTPTLDAFLAGLSQNPPRVTAGTAVFLSAHAGTAPPVLRLVPHSFGAVHQCNIIVRARTLDVPFVNPASCASWEPLSASSHSVTLRFGYMQAPNVPAALARTAPRGLDLDISRVTYFMSDQPIFVVRRLGLILWRKRLFAFLSRNARPMLGTYRLPPAQVVEMNTPREICNRLRPIRRPAGTSHQPAEPDPGQALAQYPAHAADLDSIAVMRAEARHASKPPFFKSRDDSCPTPTPLHRP